MTTTWQDHSGHRLSIFEDTVRLLPAQETSGGEAFLTGALNEAVLRPIGLKARAAQAARPLFSLRRLGGTDCQRAEAFDLRLGLGPKPHAPNDCCAAARWRRGCARWSTDEAIGNALSSDTARKFQRGEGHV